MEFIIWLIEFILHIDVHLVEIIQNYGTWTYLILFTIIFCETGLVVTPFLPGDSLLFVVGTLGAAGALNFNFVLVLLIFAAILGDAVNYFIGRLIGKKILDMNSRLIKKEYLLKTQDFYDRHGGKTVFLARFIPIIRTFAPFVAGIGKMNLSRFFLFNISGGTVWATFFMCAGYYFGNIPAVRNNFTFVIIAIIFISVLPTFIPYLQSKLKRA